MSLSTVTNPLGLVTPPNNRLLRAVELGDRIIRQAYKRYGELNAEQKRKSKKRKTIPKLKTMKYKRLGTGAYKGSFTSPTTVSVREKDTTLIKGACASRETFGLCQGSDIVWLGATTCNINQIAQVVAKAICRKLLKIAGFNITDPIQPFDSFLSHTGSSFTISSQGFVMVLTYEDADGAVTHVDFPFTTAQNLQDLAGNSGLIGQIETFARAFGSPADSKILTILRLYQWDSSSESAARLVATLNMKNEVVHLYSSVKFVVQNRTKGATSSGTESDVIDAQPLKGKMYYFSKSNPDWRPKGSNSSFAPNTLFFDRWNNDTVKLISGNETGYHGNLSEPPSPLFFSNCSKVANITLEPGDMKDFYLSNAHVKYFPSFVQSLAWCNGDGRRRQKVGDTVFIALEERLNSGSSNPIIVNYEAQANFGCYLTTNKSDPMIKTHTQVELSAGL